MYPTYNPYGIPQNAYQTQMQIQQSTIYQGGVMWGSYNDAVNYPLAPNAVITIWDNDGKTIYWKQSDAAGRQSIRILDYKDRSSAKDEQKPAQELATRQDIAGLAAAIQTLQDLVKGGGGND